MNIKDFLILAVLISLFGCSSNVKKEYTAIPSDINYSELGDVKIVSILRQDEILGQYFPVGETGANVGVMALGAVGGLIGMAVDTARNNTKKDNLQNSIESYRDMLADVNISENLQDRQVIAFENFGFDVSEYMVNPTVRFKDRLIKSFNVDISKEKLLYLLSSYSFDPEFNLIHVNTLAKLFLYEVDSKGNPIKPSAVDGISKQRGTGKYKTVIWRVNYQTPSRVRRFAPLDREKLAQDRERIVSEYDAKIQNERKSINRKSLQREKDKALRELDEMKFIVLENPEEKPPWDKVSLVEEINLAIERSSIQLVEFLNTRLTEEEFINKANFVPVLYPGKKGQIKGNMKVVELSRKDGMVTYLNKYNKLYVIPEDELIIERGTIYLK